jgi:hypothetical protein
VSLYCLLPDGNDPAYPHAVTPKQYKYYRRYFCYCVWRYIYIYIYIYILEVVLLLVVYVGILLWKLIIQCI